MSKIVDKEITFKVINKFLQHCIRGTIEQHWAWNGPINKITGYGDIVIEGRHHLAHRVSYLYFNNLKKIDKLILHKLKCNTTWCVNPNHLYTGTQKDNIADQIKLGTFKGFHACGENHYGHIFTEENITEIRQKGKYITYTQLAIEYNCSKETIRDICNYRNWKHIN